ncbi:MAG: DUF859 family phage minor structural protein [Hespellia sp.]|nr:DUF859 family phage minor structural protein [Hespellia sp.]
MADFGTSNPYINYAVNAGTVQQDVANNRSLIRVWIGIYRTNSGYSTWGNGTVYARINGGVYSADISGYVITSTYQNVGVWEVWVPHNADGTKKISVTGWINHDVFNSSEQGFDYTFTAIPRAATITECKGFTDKENPSIKFSNPGGFNLEVWLEPNTIGDHLATRTISNTGSYTWTLTDAERAKLRAACKGKTCTVRVGLYSNNKTFSNYKDVTYTMDNALPSFTSVTASLVNPFGALCLQGKSSIKFSINGATGIYGSTIESYAISGEDISYSGKDATANSNVVTTAGKRTYTATITDSRGFTASKTVDVTVTEYIYPSLSMECYRATAGSVRDDATGVYILFKPTFSCANIAGNSIASKSFSIAGVVKSTTFNSGSSGLYGTYPANHTYDVSCTIKDAVGNTVTITSQISIGSIPFNINAAKNGVGIGRYAGAANQFQVGWDMNLFGKLLMNGVNIVDFIYPVGSQIYNSKSTFNPNTLYPGTTWARIRGYVLGGVDENDKDTNTKTNFNKPSGTLMGCKQSQKHDHGFLHTAHAFSWGYQGLPSEVFIQNAIAEAGNPTSNNLMTSQGHWNKTDTAKTGDSENIQPTKLTYIWERTA